MKKVLMFLMLNLSVFTLFAQIPDGYYSDADGECGAGLKTILSGIIDDHTVVSYASLWTYFQSTDAKSNGYVWDMYSDIPDSTPAYDYTFSTDQCGSYSGEGSCYNREHSFPKSWFNDASPMYSDLFHIYATDGYVNGRRSNYPFGEVEIATWTSSNGSKLGACSYPGYTGTVFEPIDAFKGDFARTYFYMATRYESLIDSWQSNSTEADAILDGTEFPCFESWFLNMLLEWNENDPVSQKEIDRNNAVYAIQGNRNPFIDHPEYVDAIWGTGCDTICEVLLSLSSTTASEADQTLINVSAIASSAVTGDQTVIITVSGNNITSDDYLLSNTTITIANGDSIGTVTFTIIDDNDIEGSETAIIGLSDPSSGLILGSAIEQTVTIADNDTAGNGIAYEVADNDVRLYPNPVISTLNVLGFKAESLKIINSCGKVCSNVEILSYNDNELSVDVSNLKCGLFLITDGESSIRFIKQ